MSRLVGLRGAGKCSGVLRLPNIRPTQGYIGVQRVPGVILIGVYMTSLWQELRK